MGRSFFFDEGVKIGIDLGGTKIEIVAIAQDGSELTRRRVPTPAGDYEATLDALAELVREVETQLGEHGTVGIGSPGAISAATGLLRNSNSTALNGKPLARDIAQRLARDVRVANDANCLALSEATDGAGADSAVVFAAILGTGVGGGVAVDRRVLAGHNGIAGEWGHNPLPWCRDDERPGPACYCGKAGCLETFLCGPALAREFTLVGGGECTPTEIVAAAHSGDLRAQGVLTIFEDRLARGLAQIVNILDPNVVVIGGGLSKIARLYKNLPPLIERYAITRPIDVRVRPAQHGDSSGVRGAAWLW
jgi:fructokinase